MTLDFGTSRKCGEVLLPEDLAAENLTALQLAPSNLRYFVPESLVFLVKSRYFEYDNQSSLFRSRDLVPATPRLGGLTSACSKLEAKSGKYKVESSDFAK